MVTSNFHFSLIVFSVCKQQHFTFHNESLIWRVMSAEWHLSISLAEKRWNIVEPYSLGIRLTSLVNASERANFIE